MGKWKMIGGGTMKPFWGRKQWASGLMRHPKRRHWEEYKTVGILPDRQGAIVQSTLYLPSTAILRDGKEVRSTEYGVLGLQYGRWSARRTPYVDQRQSLSDDLPWYSRVHGHLSTSPKYRRIGIGGLGGTRSYFAGIGDLCTLLCRCVPTADAHWPFPVTPTF